MIATSDLAIALGSGEECPYVRALPTVTGPSKTRADNEWTV